MMRIDQLDLSEVPFLLEILEYLPISPVDEEDIVAYIKNISNVIAINYKYEQYQFSYMGIHLLLMTYIYSSIWKISKINPRRYSDAIIFARPYAGREKDIDLDNIGSIFNFSLMPEKEFAKIFKIIGLDNSQISGVGGLVKIRNDMAHACGKFEILTEDGFTRSVNTVIKSMKSIHKSMDKQIRKWFKILLIDYCENRFSDYDEVEDIINEKMLQSFKLSVNELLICKGMSVNALKTKFPNHRTILDEFKQTLTDYCVKKGYFLES